jgi:hypothetical protein
MKRLDDYRMRLVLVGIVAGIVFGGGRAKADFDFGEPTNLGPTINSAYADGSACVSSDGLELYFMSERDGGFGKQDIWLATRETSNDAWRQPVNLGSNINSLNGEYQPAISSDGLEFYFTRVLDNPNIFVSTRPSKDAPWTPAVPLGPPVSSYFGFCPEISSDGLSLYFCSYHPGGYGGSDIWVTTRAMIGDPWSEPVNLGPDVNSSVAGGDLQPSISSDGRILLFDSRRTSSNRVLWLSSRSNKEDPWAWGPPMLLGPAINLEGIKTAGPEISTDGSTLYLTSERPGGYGGIDIWQAPIIPIVDFNGDGIVDAGDVCGMIDHWATDNPLCDIGPMPWGDGIVDVEDLVVLSEHLFEQVDDPTLIAHWPLDEAQGVIAYNDASDRDGTLNNGPVWQGTSIRRHR